MRVQVFKAEDGVQDVLVRPGRRLGLPMVLLQALTPANLREKVGQAIAAVELVRVAAKTPGEQEGGHSG